MDDVEDDPDNPDDEPGFVATLKPGNNFISIVGYDNKGIPKTFGETVVTYIEPNLSITYSSKTGKVNTVRVDNVPESVDCFSLYINDTIAQDSNHVYEHSVFGIYPGSGNPYISVNAKDLLPESGKYLIKVELYRQDYDGEEDTYEMIKTISDEVDITIS